MTGFSRLRRRAGCVVFFVLVAGFPVSAFSGFGERFAVWQSPPGEAASWTRGEYRMEPAADFEMTAVVLGTRRYKRDREADLVPVDVAFGWGPMANPDVSNEIRITQKNRWYYFRYFTTPPIPKPEIIRNSANMHLIPADKTIRRKIEQLRPGESVWLKGTLVHVFAEDGWKWHSSLSREDTGDGSCELVWVKELLSFERE